MTRAHRLVAFGFRGLDNVEGGIETHARELYPRLAARGLDVCVLVRQAYAGPAGHWSRRGVRVLALRAPRGKATEAFGHALVCTVYCLATRPDVVHIHGIAPGVFAPLLRLGRITVVVTHHGHDYQAAKWGALARTALHLGERASVRGASELICVSRSIADSVRRSFGVEAVVLGNGIPAWPDSDAHLPSPSVGQLAEEPFLVVVGRVTAHKRILDVMEAVRAGLTTPDGRPLRLVVCGDLGTRDPYATQVEDAARHNPRVTLAGHVGPEDLGWIYRRATGLVMASSYEGLPLAVLEAMSAGCPVVLSDIPAHLELDLAPWQYFPLGDVACLTARLQWLLGLDRVEATALQSRRVAEARFDWDRIAGATAAVLVAAGGTNETDSRSAALGALGPMSRIEEEVA